MPGEPIGQNDAASRAHDGATIDGVHMTWWHVVWTTFLVPSPADNRGDWSDLAQVYAELAEHCQGGTDMSKKLSTRWLAKANADNAVLLSPHARQVVTKSILELATSDRVAGNTPVRALAVRPESVHVVLACPDEVLHQRIGRLKSRTATLLSFDPEIRTGGKGTWNRGFWRARLNNEVARSTGGCPGHR